MKKKEYNKPTMEVVELQRQCHILAGSQPSANGEDFIWNQLNGGNARPFFMD